MLAMNGWSWAEEMWFTCLPHVLPAGQNANQIRDLFLPWHRAYLFFFEEIIRDNLDLGRPDRVQLVFDRVVTKKTPGEFRTRVIQDGVHPSLHIEYKNFDLKQDFKEGRGCRTEGTFCNAKDFGINKGLSNLPYLQQIGRQINRRLLEVERVSHNSGLSGDSESSGLPGRCSPPTTRYSHSRCASLWIASMPSWTC